MAHIRTQIREAFVEALNAGLPSTYRAFKSRYFSRNIVDGQALVDMRFLNDQTAVPETMGDDRIHVASLYIRVQRSAPEEELDDLLDADEVAIVSAVSAHDFSALLEEKPELVQVNFVDDAETGRAAGALVMRYDLEYRIDMSDPETPIE